MNKIRKISVLIICVLLISLLAGCKSGNSADEYACFGSYSANSIVYSMVNNPGEVNSSYEISAEKFVIYSSDKTVSVEINKPKYTEKTITDNSIAIEYSEIDISSYTSKVQYDITDTESNTSNYRIYMLDDEIWFAAYDYNQAKEQEEIMYIYSLKPADN